MNSNDVRLVTWDVDGTLYSLRRMKWHVVLKYLRAGAAERQELAALRRYNEVINHAREQGGSLAGDLEDVDLDAMRVATQRWYVENIGKARPRPGVENVLNYLQSRGIPQVVFSDYEATSKLEALGLTRYFERVYAGELFGYVKPNAALLTRIAEEFSVPITCVLHIGDRVDRDEVAARAAGCRCLIYGRDFRSFEALLKKVSV